MKKLWIAGGIVVLVSAVAGATLSRWQKPEITAAMRGKSVAKELGCFACHGPDGIGGIADPLAPDGRVPDWAPAAVEQYVRRGEDIREWIRSGRIHGAPHSNPEEGSAREGDRLVPMPAYAGQLSGSELEDLVAYFVAVSGWHEDMPDDAYEGRKVAESFGCFGCHGPSGMGAVPNPGSFTGYVPAWDGEDFAELVRSEAELREWILEGRSERLWRNPLARFYLERQKIPMPAYGEHLSDRDVDRLVAYIGWVRTQ